MHRIILNLINMSVEFISSTIPYFTETDRTPKDIEIKNTKTTNICMEGTDADCPLKVDAKTKIAAVKRTKRKRLTGK